MTRKPPGQRPQQRYRDDIGGRGKELRQARARAKMDKRHGVLHVDREIERPAPPTTES